MNEARIDGVLACYVDGPFESCPIVAVEPRRRLAAGITVPGRPEIARTVLHLEKVVDITRISKASRRSSAQRFR